ncbi:MAG: hypothetical protein LBI44_07630 [Oscillospiraceae bacterium]|nr:hypothetical protein [Oscillospiraceae bacterium]
MEIARYLWLGSHAGGIGFLVSELSRGKGGGYMVVSQRVESEAWYAQVANPLG